MQLKSVQFKERFEDLNVHRKASKLCKKGKEGETTVLSSHLQTLLDYFCVYLNFLLQLICYNGLVSITSIDKFV